MNSTESNIPKCGFCGRVQTEVTRLFTGKSAFICDSCVHVCLGALSKPEVQPVSKFAGIPPAVSLEDYWRERGIPPVPSDLLDTDLLPTQREELKRAIEIVSMFQKLPSGHWGERSVNSRAQHRWPEAKYIIEDIETIRRNWFYFGVPGLIAMIKQGRSDFLDLKRVSYHSVSHEVKAMTAVEIEMPKQPVFIDAGCIVTLEFHKEFEPKVYAVGLASQFGRYQFNMVYHKPPNPPEASSFACIYTKVN